MLLDHLLNFRASIRKQLHSTGPPMGRAVIWALTCIAAAEADAFTPAIASETNVTEVVKGSPSQLYRATPSPPVTRGFGLVTISNKPPPIADYRTS